MDELVAQLTDLFNRLRLARMPLGVAEYMSLLQALRHGYGLADREALYRLCRLVWLVSLDDCTVFDYHFNAAITIALPTQSPQAEGTSHVSKEELASEEVNGSVATSLPIISGFSERYTPDEAAIMSQQIEDVSLQASIALHQTSRAEEIYSRRYQFAADYLPVSRRQLQQSWRYLRRMERVGPLVELDVPATIRQVGRNGVLIQPILRPRRLNRAALLLLLDQRGSMVPFHFLCRSLAETVTASGSFGQVGVYYFHNCPPQVEIELPTPSQHFYREHLLYQRELCLEARPVSEIMAEFRSVRPDVLIFSDAGAARGTWNRTRIEDTATFLHQLRLLGAKQFAWLNALPPGRWEGTSAGVIAKFVPMLYLDGLGLTRAINVLRSHSRFTIQF